ncbi:hypothetical protein J1N51_05910 [Psychrosphaera ytuae]|uniref:Uncharacterized protein n=1 Tax=Psychrosphaera ytuae TaxID=2820710 RepID=A0A975DD60_9GAMM|nr:hypothetical protein [Psychrosphaera ytuae]QTH64982.1 hypothetical protein J1N51_05910 [Psychrosphaera ytuae]
MLVALLTVNIHAGYIDSFHIKRVVSPNPQNNDEPIVTLSHRESKLEFQTIERKGLYYDVKVVNQDKVLFEDTAPYSHLVMSSLGTAALIVNTDIENSTKRFTVLVNNQRYLMLEEYPAQSLIDYYDPYMVYRVSDDGMSILMGRIKEDEGLVEAKTCDVTVTNPKCSEVKVEPGYFLSGVALLDKNRVIVLSSSTQVNESDGQRQYSLSSVIQMFEGDSLLWEHSLGNSTEYKWESATINSYKKELVVYSHNHIEIRDIETGNLVWNLNKKETDHKINSMYDVYLEEGKIIVPFADGTGLYRRTLTN